MTEHRFKNLIEEYTTATNIKDSRSLESLFDGPKKLEEIYHDYIAEIEREKAYRQGFADGQSAAQDKINLEIRKRIEEYIGKVVQISNYIARVSSEMINKDGEEILKIIDARARFSFEKNKIQVLFLIDSSFEKEVSFIKLCGNIEKLITELEHDYLASISCVNISSRDVDYSLIKSDYPFLIKLT